MAEYQPVDLLEFLDQLVASYDGSQKITASYLGISEQHMSDLIRGRRSPSVDLLDRMGLKKVVLYVHKESLDETSDL